VSVASHSVLIGEVLAASSRAEAVTLAYRNGCYGSFAVDL
jgi:hypothetical protein